MYLSANFVHYPCRTLKSTFPSWTCWRAWNQTTSATPSTNTWNASGKPCSTSASVVSPNVSVMISEIKRFLANVKMRWQSSQESKHWMNMLLPPFLHSQTCNINDHLVISTLICQVKPLHQNFKWCASVLQRPAVFLSWAQYNCDWIFAVQEMNISLKLCSSWRSRNYTVKRCDCTQQTDLTTRYQHTCYSHSSPTSYSSLWSQHLSAKYLLY